MAADNGAKSQGSLRRRRVILIVIGVGLIALIVWQVIARLGPPVETEPYVETFDSVGSWIAGHGAVADGIVEDGSYKMSIMETGDIFWATGGRHFGDGIYEVQATPLEGAIDNGYGMLFKVDNEEGHFYVFKVSSDGYVFIGRCEDSCFEVDIMVDQDWFAVPEVRQGLGVTNNLRVVAAGSDYTFYVNDIEVGAFTDDTFPEGDIGLLVETFTPGGLTVAFDNFKVTPQ